MSAGELTPMRIVAYKKATYEEREKVANGEYNAQVNPETYSQSFEIEYDEDQAPGTSTKLPKYNKTKPQKLEFEFLFDSSGALPRTTDEQRRNGVIDDIEQFKSVVFSFDGDTHRPPFLILSWGTLLFKCVLTGMNITYKMFRPDGSPVRAVVKAAFQGLMEDDLRVRTERKESPDLTHIITVKVGDTLPLLCNKIYGNTKYYIEVARVNKLVNFRNIQPGQQIQFPPLAKAK